MLAHVSIPGSSPAGAGDAFASWVTESSFQLLFLCFYPFSGAGKLGEGMGEATRGAEMEEVQQRANNALESEETVFWTQLCLISAFAAFLSLKLIIHQTVLSLQWSKDVCCCVYSTFIQYLQCDLFDAALYPLQLWIGCFYGSFRTPVPARSKPFDTNHTLWWEKDKALQEGEALDPELVHPRRLPGGGASRMQPQGWFELKEDRTECSPSCGPREKEKKIAHSRNII